MVEKQGYKFGLGLWKTLKNTAIVLVLPEIYYLINNWQVWVPTQYNVWAVPIFGFVGYFIKNFVENK
jgi:hypothetical protein